MAAGVNSTKDDLLRKWNRQFLHCPDVTCVYFISIWHYICSFIFQESGILRNFTKNPLWQWLPYFVYIWMHQRGFSSWAFDYLRIYSFITMEEVCYLSNHCKYRAIKTFIFTEHLLWSSTEVFFELRCWLGFGSKVSNTNMYIMFCSSCMIIFSFDHLIFCNAGKQNYCTCRTTKYMCWLGWGRTMADCCISNLHIFILFFVHVWLVGLTSSSLWINLPPPCLPLLVKSHLHLFQHLEKKQNGIFWWRKITNQYHAQSLIWSHQDKSQTIRNNELTTSVDTILLSIDLWCVANNQLDRGGSSLEQLNGLLVVLALNTHLQTNMVDHHWWWIRTLLLGTTS